MTSACRRVALAVLLLAAPAMAQAQGDPAVADATAPAIVPPSLVDAAADLSPGEFIWASEASPQGPISVVVSIQRQLAYVYRGATLIGASTVSTGRPGHETPTGTFPILQKQVFHRSNKYDDAPMPYMQRLTWDGVALHAGTLPGHPASHGCVRLPATFAKQLYGLTSIGASVTIAEDDAALSPGVVTASVEAPAAVAAAAAVR